MPRPIPFLDKLRRHNVALISLAVALISLSYNTWRNETTEHQRNLRHASFQLVEELGALQSRANQVQYGSDPDNEAWIEGWGRVLTIRSLGTLLPEPVPGETERLHTVWGERVGALGGDDEAARSQAEAAINGQIERTRQAVLDTLAELD